MLIQFINLLKYIYNSGFLFLKSLCVSFKNFPKFVHADYFSNIVFRHYFPLASALRGCDGAYCQKSAGKCFKN